MEDKAANLVIVGAVDHAKSEKIFDGVLCSLRVNEIRHVDKNPDLRGCLQYE